MMTYLKEVAAKLENPAPPPVLSPAAMRDLAAIQEASSSRRRSGSAMRATRS
jgi:hypothetical protein